MSNFAEHTLGPKANEYVLECLEYGHSLSRRLRSNLDLKEGRVVTRLPLAANNEDLNKFEWGGKYPGSPNQKRLLDKEDPLVLLVKDFLGCGEKKVCVFENYVAHRTDPWLSHAKSCVLFFGDEVYHLVAQKDAKPDIIKVTIREAESLTIFVGVLSILPQGYQLGSCGGRLTEDDLRILAEQAEKIIVRAYDGEGYLIWNKA